MTQHLKRWESPRSEGRNRKGRGGSAKQRHYKKRQKLLSKRLQEGSDRANPKSKNSPEINNPEINLETQLAGANTKKYKQKGAIEQPLFFAPCSPIAPLKTDLWRCQKMTG